jgi:dihydrofolate reductase
MVAQTKGSGTMPGVTAVVVSRTLRQNDHPGLTIIGGDLASERPRLRERPGKDIWLFGGGNLFASLLEIGQVDTIEVAVIPVLLGGGLPLLPAPSLRTKLQLVGSRVYKKTGTVSLEYAVER